MPAAAIGEEARIGEAMHDAAQRQASLQPVAAGRNAPVAGGERDRREAIPRRGTGDDDTVTSP